MHDPNASDTQPDSRTDKSVPAKLAELLDSPELISGIIQGQHEPGSAHAQLQSALLATLKEHVGREASADDDTANLDQQVITEGSGSALDADSASSHLASVPQSGVPASATDQLKEQLPAAGHQEEHVVQAAVGDTVGATTQLLSLGWNAAPTTNTINAGVMEVPGVDAAVDLGAAHPVLTADPPSLILPQLAPSGLPPMHPTALKTAANDDSDAAALRTALHAVAHATASQALPPEQATSLTVALMRNASAKALGSVVDEDIAASQGAGVALPAHQSPAAPSSDVAALTGLLVETLASSAAMQQPGPQLQLGPQVVNAQVALAGILKPPASEDAPQPAADESVWLPSGLRSIFTGAPSVSMDGSAGGMSMSSTPQSTLSSAMAPGGERRGRVYPQLGVARDIWGQVFNN